MAKITVGFPTRVPQVFEGYPSGPGWMFPFHFEVQGEITSRQNALIAAAFFREDFLKQAQAAGLQFGTKVFEDGTYFLACKAKDGIRIPWVPGCYLEKCAYAEVNGREIS